MDRKVAVVPATFGKPHSSRTRTLNVDVLRLLLGWDDVGDFSSLADLLPAESNQPRILGDGGLGMFPGPGFMLRR